MEDNCYEVIQKCHSICELIPSDKKFPFTKVEISGEEVLTVNQSSSWEIEKIFTDYRFDDKPHETFMVVFRHKE